MPAVIALGSSNGKAATPVTRNRTGGAAVAAPRVQSPRRVISAPGRRSSAFASWRLTTSRGSSPPSARQVTSFEEDPRPAAALRVRAQEEDLLRAPIRSGDGRVAADAGRRPRPRRAGRAMAAAAASASAIRGRAKAGASAAITRTSKPAQSSSARNETSSPRERSSMSKSRAPTAATPRIPRIARPGWRTRLRRANAHTLTLIGGPGPWRHGGAGSRTRPRWPRSPGGRPPRPRARRWRA